MVGEGLDTQRQACLSRPNFHRTTNAIDHFWALLKWGEVAWEKSRRNQSMYLALFSLNIVALLLASMKSSVMSLKRKWLIFNSKDILCSVKVYILPYVIFDNIWSATDFSLQRRRVTIVVCIKEKIIHLNSCRGEKLHCIPQGCAKSFKLDVALRLDLCLNIWQG